MNRTLIEDAPPFVKNRVSGDERLRYTAASHRGTTRGPSLVSAGGPSLVRMRHGRRHDGRAGFDAPAVRPRPRVLHVLEAIEGGTSRHLVNLVRYVDAQHVVVVPP